MLLAIKGLAQDKQPTIKQIAGQLQLQHHSVVELTARLNKRGLIRRSRSLDDKRAVLLSLTRSGEKLLERVAQYSFSQLETEAPQLLKSLGCVLKGEAKL